MLRDMGDGAPFVSGVDAPEVGSRAECPKEDALGLAARDRLQQLLDTEAIVIEDSGKVDRFERPLVWLRRPDGSSVGATLVAEGLAREWRPDATIDWCQ